jgi:hypothetical protein
MFIGWRAILIQSGAPVPGRREIARLVINAVGRFGDHKVRRDATEHARNVGRHCAVAAEQAMAAEHP